MSQLFFFAFLISTRACSTERNKFLWEQVTRSMSCSHLFHRNSGYKGIIAKQIVMRQKLTTIRHPTITKLDKFMEQEWGNTEPWPTLTVSNQVWVCTSPCLHFLICRVRWGAAWFLKCLLVLPIRILWDALLPQLLSTLQVQGEYSCILLYTTCSNLHSSNINIQKKI